MRSHCTEDYNDNNVTAPVDDHRPDVEMVHKFNAENIDTSRDDHDSPESALATSLADVQKDCVVSLIHIIGIAEDDICVDLCGDNKSC